MEQQHERLEAEIPVVVYIFLLCPFNLHKTDRALLLFRAHLLGTFARLAMLPSATL